MTGGAVGIGLVSVRVRTRAISTRLGILRRSAVVLLAVLRGRAAVPPRRNHPGRKSRRKSRRNPPGSSVVTSHCGRIEADPTGKHRFGHTVVGQSSTFPRLDPPVLHPTAWSHGSVLRSGEPSCLPRSRRRDFRCRTKDPWSSVTLPRFSSRWWFARCGAARLLISSHSWIPSRARGSRARALWLEAPPM